MRAFVRACGVGDLLMIALIHSDGGGHQLTARGAYLVIIYKNVLSTYN